MTIGILSTATQLALSRALGFLVLLAACGSSPAQTNGVSVPLEFKHGHIMVPARVSGSNSVWLMLDTGFSITMIDPRLAELLRLHRMGNTTIAGIAGQEKAELFEGPTFEFAGASYGPRRVAALPAENRRRSRRLEGILGAGFFRRFVVKIDTKAQMVQLFESNDYEYSGAGEVVPFKIKNSTPVVEAVITVAGGALIHGQFEIDTGCDGGLCLGHDFVEANNLLEAGGRIASGARSGVGGDAATKVGSVPQLQVGRVRVEKPETNFFLRGSPVDHGHAGHIGLGALRQFGIIFDYSRQQLILEPSSQRSPARAR